MRWQFGRRSQNVEDRRGMRGSGPVVGGGIGAIVLAVIVTLLGGDPSVIFEQAAPTQQDGYPNQGQRSPEEDRLADFSNAVLAQTEDVWTEVFREEGIAYREPKLVLFTGQVRSECGAAQAAMGPFYCPLDEKVYLDLSFFREMRSKLNAPGDFAQAYVIAHEVGHHVQKQLGISDQIQSLQRRTSKTQANQLSVRLELQADCFAGIWANRAEQSKQILEQGDIEEALNAATQIGDDRLQAKSQGYIVPDAFTHGSSAQRVRWFKRGIQTGDPAQCDTFNASSL